MSINNPDGNEQAFGGGNALHFGIFFYNGVFAVGKRFLFTTTSFTVRVLFHYNGRPI